MDDAALYILLQGAVERSKGAATWTDVRLALMRAKEAKIKAALDSVFAEFTLEQLMNAERISDKEVFRVLPTPSAPPPPPPPPPPAKQAKKFFNKK